MDEPVRDNRNKEEAFPSKIPSQRFVDRGKRRNIGSSTGLYLLRETESKMYVCVYVSTKRERIPLFDAQPHLSGASL
jgi:hypothetical protein